MLVPQISHNVDNAALMPSGGVYGDEEIQKEYDIPSESPEEGLPMEEANKRVGSEDVQDREQRVDEPDFLVRDEAECEDCDYYCSTQGP